MNQILSAFFLSAIFSLSASAQEFVKGEYLVKVKANIDSISAEEMFSQVGFQSHTVSPKNNIYGVKSTLPHREALRQLNAIPMVEYAEPNYILKIDQTPNDKKYKEQWGLKDKKGFDVHAEAMWDRATSSKDIVIAVVDTGINTLHPDLAENIWTNEAEANGKPGVDDDGNGFIDDVHGFHFAYPKKPVADRHGHGTHCAGIIAARGNNGIGVSGLLWDAKLMAVGFLDEKGSGTTENGIRGIDYAVMMGARVISASWGGGGPSKAMLESITKANEAGVVFVAAAGNESANNDKGGHYPSNYKVDNVISVAASTRTGGLASFSNRGVKTVHIAAPGDWIFSTFGNSYTNLSGTSMATPFVSAAAAMTLANHPNYTPLQVRQTLMDSSTKIKSLTNKVMSGGLLNAEGAL
jgi:subtilisin family serine protease